MARSRTLSFTVKRRTGDTFDAILNSPAKMMSDAVKSDDGWWMFSTPRGPAKLKFNENRSFGILDCVYIDEESKWDVPMRVVPSAEESEIMITLVKPENVSDEQFNQRMDEIGQAFSNLKSLIEKPL